MKVAFSKPELPSQGAYIVGVLEGRKLTNAAAQAEKATKGAVSRALNASRFKGGHDEQLILLAPQGLDASRLILSGLGSPAKLDGFAFEAIGGRLIAALNGAGEREATIAVESIAGCSLSEGEIAARIAAGARLRSYRFDKYRTKEKPEHKPTLKKLTITLGDPASAKKAFDPLDKIVDSVIVTRNLVSEPANIIYPATLAKEASQLADLGVTVQVLGEKEMKKLGMGALLGVGQGSERESQLVTMVWNGASDSKAKPICFVGKGVTFDTGGISLKPGAEMDEMKFDMCGAASVLGTLKAIAEMKLRINVVGIIPATENMPAGNATKPGDIVTTMSGQTVEILNTDAEGRLILCDALTYAERYKPQAVIDIATLTGACVIALGHVVSGLFANDDALAAEVLKAGETSGDRAWHLPLHEEYQEQLRSNFADFANIGGRPAGAVTAACYLARFTKKFKWVHLDIAGTAWKSGKEKGSTGRPVPLLTQFLIKCASRL